MAALRLVVPTDVMSLTLSFLVLYLLKMWFSRRSFDGL